VEGGFPAARHWRNNEGCVLVLLQAPSWSAGFSPRETVAQAKVTGDLMASVAGHTRPPGRDARLHGKQGCLPPPGPLQIFAVRLTEGESRLPSLAPEPINFH